MAAALIFLLAAAVPGAVAASPETLPSQQLFDQASAAAEKGDCRTAASLFDALEKRKVLKPDSIPEAVVSVRRGGCLVRVRRIAEGERAIQKGLPVLEKAGPDYVNDVVNATEALGDVAIRYHDHDRGIAQYQRVLGMVKGLSRLRVLAELAKATAFDGGTTSLAYSEEGIALISALPPKDQNKDSLAVFHSLHARTLLNQGKTQEGYAELKQALKLSGGLTARTTTNEVSMRSDLGMAAALVGRKEDARLYLAYTGAGRIAGGARFTRGMSMDPPLCGEETGLRPDDVAVVEFSINEDGSVAGANTVYSRGNRAVATAFARAVDDWYWSPDSIKAIPLFYRTGMRVEMRCSTAGGDAPSILSPANARFWTWASSRLPALRTEESGQKKVEAVRLALAQDRFAAGSAERAAALGVVAALSVSSSEARSEDTVRAMAAATEAKAPPEVVNWLRINSVLSGETGKDRKARLALQAMAAEPSFAADPLSSATALLLASAKYRGSRLPEAPAMLQQVADDGRLPDRHPLRQAARITLANLAAAAGDGAAAQRFFASTGLTEQQCALIGVRPALRSSGADSNDYPMEAMRMGFEGWVNLEFDVTADGRTATARPIVAYPPLIFVDAAAGMAKGFRYEASYRPGGGAACTANRETVSFILP
ncbi:energy transducer TonB [Sphingobium sufflavum]|uniref:energy transducer TonB n=1 Tax=Sphingobium sufflavum TaxID=1129547 RepID=UPI001F185C73|nr:energy transducer TonB [Sphingobium sufflavum]MCE7796004.1 energy transducer TonB [Sphingobium sufflavum]